jgi:caffeoyl-CoA O-methyltransferase
VATIPPCGGMYPTGKTAFRQVEDLIVWVIGWSYARCMLYARAEVATPTPDRYIRQLVSHLSHKATTELQSDETGLIIVHDGHCKLTSDGELLVLEAAADGAEGLAHIKDVVGRHLERFGARAALQVEWRSDGPAVTT